MISPNKWIEYLKSKENSYYSIYDSRTLGNNSKCWYCGSDGIMTKDHFLPKCMGGVLKVYCCKPCNQLKGNLTPKAWISWIESRIMTGQDVYRKSILLRMKKATETLWDKVKDSI